jgi:plasmid replication initiation protein
MAAMSSKYALILYEIGKQRLRMPDFSWEGTVGELRELLGVGKGKMLNWTDLRKRTLDAAAKDLDDLAPFTMRIEETRHGRTVKRVRLLFISKDDDAAAAAARLVHATKLERKARRGHGVETVIGPALSAEEERRIAALRAELPPLDLADDLDDAIPY